MAAEEPSLKQKTAKGILWGGVSNGVQQVLSLICGLYFARKLSDTDYGIYGELVIFHVIACCIINSGLSISLINKKNATQKDYDAVFWFSFLTAATLYIILFLCAPLIADFFRQPELLAVSRVVFLGFLIGSLGITSSAIMMKEMRTKQIGIIQVIALASSLCVGMLMVMHGHTYWAIAVQNTLSLALTPLIMFFIAPWKPTLHINFSPLKRMMPFCVRMFFTNIISQINATVFNVIFGKFFNVESVGQFYQGQKWSGFGQSFINGMLNIVSQPVFATINEERERQQNAIRKMIRFGAFVSFPLLFGLAFAGKEIIIVALTAKWLPALPYMQILCLWAAVAFLSTIFTNLIYAHEKSGIYLKITTIVGILQWASIAAMAYFGAIAMVIGFVCANYVGLLIWHYYVKKIVGLRLRDVLHDVLPYLGVTLGSFILTWLLTHNIQNIYLLLSAKIAIAGCIYLLALKLLNSVMFNESIAFLLKRKQ